LKARHEQRRAGIQIALAARNGLKDRLGRADEIFEVLTDIGVILFRLEVADRAKAKAAWKEVDEVLSKKDTVIGMAFEAAKKRKIYGFSPPPRRRAPFILSLAWLFVQPASPCTYTGDMAAESSIIQIGPLACSIKELSPVWMRGS
jgi:hypothetical protein